MNQIKKEFLSLNIKPARLSYTQTAWLLGFGDHDITVLVSCKLLKPLGSPTRTGSKYFAAVEIEALRNNVHWLAKATDATVKYWRLKNAGRNQKLPPPLGQ